LQQGVTQSTVGNPTLPYRTLPSPTLHSGTETRFWTHQSAILRVRACITPRYRCFSNKTEPGVCKTRTAIRFWTHECRILCGGPYIRTAPTLNSIVRGPSVANHTAANKPAEVITRRRQMTVHSEARKPTGIGSHPTPSVDTGDRGFLPVLSPEADDCPFGSQEADGPHILFRPQTEPGELHPSSRGQLHGCHYHVGARFRLSLPRRREIQAVTAMSEGRVG